jgi:hypothetical protein
MEFTKMKNLEVLKILSIWVVAQKKTKAKAKARAKARDKNSKWMPKKARKRNLRQFNLKGKN